MHKRNKILTSAGILLFLCLFAVAVLIFFLPFDSALRVVLTVLLVLFLPGFLASSIIYFQKKTDLFERIIVSFALSMVLVPLPLFYLNRMGPKITSWSVIGVVFLINVLLGVGLIVRYLLSKKKK